MLDPALMAVLLTLVPATLACMVIVFEDRPLARIGDWLTKRERDRLTHELGSVTQRALQGARLKAGWNLPWWNDGPVKRAPLLIPDTRCSWEITQDPQFYARVPQPGGYAFDPPHRCATVRGLHRHACYDPTHILYFDASDDPKNVPPHDPVTGEVHD